MVQELSLSELKVLTVAEVAVLKEKAVRTVQKWILDGLLPVFVVGTGKRTVYLLREVDVKTFTPPPMGRPKAEHVPPRKKAPANKQPGKK